MSEGNEWGAEGEQLAMEHLLKEGYTIRERNWKCGKLELDIVAQLGTMIVIVEVKSRNGRHGDPLDALDKKKIRRILNAANVYMGNLEHEMDCRFDVVTLVGNKDSYVLDHIVDAFFPPLCGTR